MQSEPPRRIVRVKALADPSFRARNPSWNQELRGVIEAASEYFEREFDIRLLTQSTAPWPAEERVASTPALLLKLKQEFPAAGKDGSYDIIIAVTAERLSRYVAEGRPRVDRIGNCQQGLGNYVVITASNVFRGTGARRELEYDTVALIHELGHIFGAEHVQDSRSIMHENFDYRSEFDMRNRSVILQNRDCPFAK
jgi:Metallo-peptidase family M12